MEVFTGDPQTFHWKTILILDRLIVSLLSAEFLFQNLSRRSGFVPVDFLASSVALCRDSDLRVCC